ncbi:MAG: protein translocase subunit SecF [Alphaproteobacteria bacterium]|nr:protein translocase subunit SecF [Alphaproteobacteria bacterium]
MFDLVDKLKERFDSASFDFVAWRNVAGGISLVLVLLSWALFFGVGPKWGIDFTGGTEIHLRFDDDIAITDLRAALESLGIQGDAVQEVGGEGEHEFKVRIQDASFGSDALKAQVIDDLKKGMTENWVADWDRDITFSAEVGARFAVHYQGDRVLPGVLLSKLGDIQGVKVDEGREDNELIIKLPGLATQIEKEIKGAMGDRHFEVLSVDAVGPKVGESLRRQGVLSLASTLALVLVYVAFRFEIAFAPGAILALIHDVSLTVGLFIVLGREFNLPIIGALLTIVGYSLNDTIIIYDRIRENRSRHRREDLPGLINASISETLSRTIATSGTTFMAILPFMFLTSSVLADFVLAMLFGIVVGTYSTIFVASPMILFMDRVQPYLSKLVAIDTGEDVEAGEDIPEQFLSESEKRRRERDRLEQEAQQD